MKLSIHGSHSIFGDVQIEERNRLGRGGAATVYRVEIAGTSWAAKIFDQERPLNTQRILAMMANVPVQAQVDVTGQSHPQLAWPQALLKDNNGTDVGFLMPLVDPRFSFSLDHFYDQVLFDKLGSKEEAALSFRAEICQNLSALVANLHAQGHYMIDCKPQNIRVFRRSHAVSLIDCDGFSIFTEAKRYPAELVSTDYISPEAFRQHLSPAVLGEAQDRYALAVILFQLLNRGTHPFQGVVSDASVIANTNDEKAAAGLYPHGTTADPRITPRRQSLHHLWDRKTRELFDRAFLNTHQDNRPSAAEWADHFKSILENKQLVRCEREPDKLEHIRFKGEGCPACYLDSLPKPASKAKATPQKPKPTAPKPPPTNALNPAPVQQKPPTSNGMMMFVAVVVLSGASYFYLNKPKENASNDVDPKTGIEASVPDSIDNEKTVPNDMLDDAAKRILDATPNASPSGQAAMSAETRNAFENCISVNDTNDSSGLIEACSKAINSFQLNVGELAKAYATRGSIYVVLGLSRLARSDLNDAILTEPETPTAHYFRGMLNYVENMDEEAVVDFTSAIRLNPDIAYAYNGRGLAHMRMQRFDLAIQDFDQALALAPHLDQAVTNRAQAVAARANSQ